MHISLLRKKLFIKSYIELLENQYNMNRKLLAKVLHSKEAIQVQKLIKEQIYIKRMINTGREMQRDYIKNDLL